MQREQFRLGGWLQKECKRNEICIGGPLIGEESRDCGREGVWGESQLHIPNEDTLNAWLSGLSDLDIHCEF